MLQSSVQQMDTRLLPLRTNESFVGKLLEEVPRADALMDALGKRYDKKKGTKRSFKKSGKSEDASATVHQVYAVSNDEGVTHYLYNVAGKTRAHEWVLDSGVSTHTTGDEKLLSDLKPMKAVAMTVARGDRLTAAAIESASFPGVQGTVTLTGILLVPGLHKNLISVPKLMRKL